MSSLLRSLCAVVLVGLLSSKASAIDAPIVANVVPEQNLGAGVVSKTVNLNSVFAVPNTPGPLVEFTFGIGKMVLALYPDVAPQTVNNFLRYTDNRIYDNTFIHRSIKNFVIQGGGYELVNGTPHVLQYSPIVNEYNRPNVAGTIAMAKLSSDLNSATSEWFFNLQDNPQLNDELDSNGNPQKFAVFGRLLGNGLGFIKTIANIPTVDAGGAFGYLPVRNYTAGSGVLLTNLVELKTVRRLPLLKLDPTKTGYLTITATSSKLNAILPEVTPAGLKLIGGNQPGSATITLNAKDATGQVATTSFTAISVTPTYVIALKASPAAYGSVSGANGYLSGTKVTVKAIPKAGRKFVKWTEGGKTVSVLRNYRFTASKKRSLVAVFSN